MIGIWRNQQQPTSHARRPKLALSIGIIWLCRWRHMGWEGDLVNKNVPWMASRFLSMSWWWERPPKFSKLGHWRILITCTYCTCLWPRNHFRVAESSFWGYFPQMFGGSLYWLEFLEFKNCDWKCCFRDVFQAFIHENAKYNISDMAPPITI